MQATAIKPKNKTELFIELLEDRLTAGQYNNLHILLGHNGSHRVTRLLNPTCDKLAEFNLEEVYIFSKMLRVTPTELVFDWGVGKDNISLSQAEAMVEDEGMSIGPIQHAA